MVQETDSTIVVDGNWGFGFVVSEYVMKTIIKKASVSGVAAATVRRQGHVGRVADYPLMASDANMIGLMTADSGRSAKSVAPFGGREARLGTNPICIAIPSNLEGPIFVDMATSAVAGGKIILAAARGAPIPEGATTVVPFEDTDENQQKESNITKIGIKLKTEKFENIRGFLTMAYQVYMESFGCQMNEYDTELVRSLLKKQGFIFIGNQDQADVILLNTCAIRENALNRVSVS